MYAAKIGWDLESGGSVTWFPILVIPFFHADHEHCLCKQKKLRMGDVKLRIELCHGIKLKQKSLNFYMLKKKKDNPMAFIPHSHPYLLWYDCCYDSSLSLLLYTSVSP